MNSLAVLIPVKSSGIKSRLSPTLSREERRRIQSLLLAGVLRTLDAAEVLHATYVVSSDPGILRFASRSGAGVVREAGDKGVNAAVEAGLEALGRPAKVLVLPSDLPFLSPSEVKHILSLGETLEVVIAPSQSFNGTNALIFKPGKGFPLSYDNDSFWNHVRACGRRSLSLGVTSEPGLTFDLDSPGDLERLARLRTRNPVAAFARRVSR